MLIRKNKKDDNTSAVLKPMVLMEGGNSKKTSGKIMLKKNDIKNPRSSSSTHIRFGQIMRNFFNRLFKKAIL